MVVFGRLLYSDKCGCIRAKWLYSGKSGCIRAKLYSGEVVVIRSKVVVIRQKWLLQAKWL